MTQPPADRPERQELEALKELRDIIAANALNRRDIEGDFGASHEFDVLWKCYHAVWGALVRATAMLQKAHNQTPLCWVRPGDVEFLNQGEPDVSDPAEVELSPMEDASEGQTMPLYARPGLMVPPPADAKMTPATHEDRNVTTDNQAVDSAVAVLAAAQQPSGGGALWEHPDPAVRDAQYPAPPTSGEVDALRSVPVEIGKCCGYIGEATALQMLHALRRVSAGEGGKT